MQSNTLSFSIKLVILLFETSFYGLLIGPNSLVIAKDTPDFKAERVVISGQVKFAENSSRVISLIYSQLTATPTRLTSILDSSGRFQFEFEIVSAHDLTVRYEKGVVDLYVKPLDSLYIRLNSADFQRMRYPTVSISGNHPETSRDILSYHQYNKLESFKPIPKDKSTEVYLAAIQKRILTEDSVLSTFNSHHHPTQEFRNWAKKDILYRNANYLVDFEAFHSFQKIPLKGVLYDTSLFPVNDTDAVVSSWYQYHLWQYAMSKYTQRDSVIQNLFRQQRFGEAYGAGLKKIIAIEKPGVSRDIMCYQILVALSERAYNDFHSLMSTVDRYVANKALVSLLLEKVRQGKNRANYHISVFKPDSKEEKEIIGDVMENLISMHKGKVIYLDFWATWCGPCRSEVPHAIDLHAYYKDKPVVFVNLCLASDREAWKNAIEKQQIAGENYYFDKDQSELLTRKLKLAGFPTYMIIDKDGQIVDRQAPRPSSGNTIKTRLTQLLD